MPLAWRDNCFAHWDTNQESLAGRESQRATPQSAMPQIVRSIGDLCVRNVQVRLVQAVWLPQMTQGRVSPTSTPTSYLRETGPAADLLLR